MKSLSSFIGKCLTILVGMSLSWATVTMPEIDALAAALCGGVHPRASAVGDLHPPALLERVAVSSVPEESAVPVNRSQLSPGHEPRIQEISRRLKQLGASYLLLEKLPQEHGAQYRVRCDLAKQHSPLKCCFEATRATALAAMEDVLRAVQQNAGQGDNSRPTVATSS